MNTWFSYIRLKKSKLHCKKSVALYLTYHAFLRDIDKVETYLYETRFIVLSAQSVVLSAFLNQEAFDLIVQKCSYDETYFDMVFSEYVEAYYRFRLK